MQGAVKMPNVLSTATNEWLPMIHVSIYMQMCPLVGLCRTFHCCITAIQGSLRLIDQTDTRHKWAKTWIIQCLWEKESKQWAYTLLFIITWLQISPEKTYNNVCFSPPPSSCYQKIQHNESLRDARLNVCYPISPRARKMCVSSPSKQRSQSPAERCLWMDRKVSKSLCYSSFQEGKPSPGALQAVSAKALDQKICSCSLMNCTGPFHPQCCVQFWCWEVLTELGGMQKELLLSQEGWEFVLWVLKSRFWRLSVNPKAGRESVCSLSPLEKWQEGERAILDKKWCWHNNRYLLGSHLFLQKI